MLSTPRHGFSGIAAHQLAILDRMQIPVLQPGEEAIPSADLIIDGLLGFRLQGDPHGEVGRLITLANAHPAPILAIDLPSGLNATSGEIGNPCIEAMQTVTLALPKSGLVSAPERITGDIWIADIGVPPDAYSRIGVDVPSGVFAGGSLIRYR
jgi:NAD(P)H-hydrate epimerase